MCTVTLAHQYSPFAGVLGQLVKNCCPWDGLMLEQSMEDFRVSCGRVPMLEQGQESSP